MGSEHDFTTPFDCSIDEALRRAASELKLDYVERAPLGSGAAQFQHGVRCGGAADKARCDAAWAALDGTASSERGLGWQVDGMPEVIRYTRGDEAGELRSAQDVTALIAPVDTAARAFVLLFGVGQAPTCDTGWFSAKGTRPVVRSSFYESTCSPIRTAYVVSRVEADGRLVELERATETQSQACIGRLTDGYCAQGSDAVDPVGRWLANSAELEGAAVLAFVRLRGELRAHGAPVALQRLAGQAAREEVQHARDVSAAAARHQATAPRPRHGARPAPRSLLAMALENAREGCVREMYGALEASVRAHNAGPPHLRALFTKIAHDECGHAELSWRVAQWLDTRLTPAERAQVAAARAEAVRELAQERSAPHHEPAEVGPPTAAQTHALLAQLDRALDALAA